MRNPISIARENGSCRKWPVTAIITEDGRHLWIGSALVNRDLAILFFHHNCEEITRYHFEMLKFYNPGVPVVPVVRGEALHLSAAVDVQRDDEWSHERNWEGADIALLQWFRQRSFDAERYLWVEYDSLCSISLREWYADVWDADAAGARLETINPDWYFWRDVQKLPPAYRAVAASFSPFNGIMVSHRALSEVSVRFYPKNVFCELRFPTAIRAAGFSLATLPLQKGNSNRFRASDITVTESAGFFHPVKTIKRIGPVVPPQRR